MESIYIVTKSTPEMGIYEVKKFGTYTEATEYFNAEADNMRGIYDKVNTSHAGLGDGVTTLAKFYSYKMGKAVLYTTMQLVSLHLD